MRPVLLGWSSPIFWLLAPALAQPAFGRHIVGSAILFALSSLSTPVLRAAEKPLADTQIHYDGSESSAVKDLQQVLAPYKAGEITLEKAPQAGRTGQEFYLQRINGRTLIKYTAKTSLENGIYTLLDRWGFHWYG